MSYRLALAQFAPEKGRVEDNLDRIAELAAQAASEGAEFVAFPEAAVTGYELEMAVVERALTAERLEEELRARLPAGPACLVGFYELHESDAYNSAALFYDGSVLEVVRKFFLPTYGVFQEQRYLANGSRIAPIDSPFGKLGVLICEDVWHSIVPTSLALQGATTVLALCASPARGFRGESPANVLRYERILRAVAEEHGVYAGSSMLCGFEGGKGFTGGSAIFDPHGELLAQAPLLEEAIVFADVDESEVARARATSPLLDDLRARLPDVIESLRSAPRP